MSIDRRAGAEHQLASSPRCVRVRRGVTRAAAIMGTLWLVAGAGQLAAQSVVLQGPAGTTLPSPTPAFTVRANGFGAARPLTVTLQIATAPDFNSGVLVDSTFTTADTVIAVQITRLLASEAQVFWRARVSTPDGRLAESATTGPRIVPVWLELLFPNSATADFVDSRRPRFVWRSAPVTPLLGPWRYTIEVTSDGRPEQGATGILDTTYRAETDLQTSTSYQWSIRATLDNGTSVTAASKATFLVTEESLPPRTLMYQNFPNPFPSPVAFSTCIWFDVAPPGARIVLDVTDLRGNLIKTLIPGLDGQRDFQPGRYGRGSPGAGNTCDNRFVWDGTGNDGRSVAAGVYLLRFQAGRGAPTFRRMLFLGR